MWAGHCPPRACGAEDEKAAGEANAKDFLLNTAKRSLEEAFGISVARRF